VVAGTSDFTRGRSNLLNTLTPDPEFVVSVRWVGAFRMNLGRVRHTESSVGRPLQDVGRCAALHDVRKWQERQEMALTSGDGQIRSARDGVDSVGGIDQPAREDTDEQGERDGGRDGQTR
jgi:hypothetical protein